MIARGRRNPDRAWLSAWLHDSAVFVVSQLLSGAAGWVLVVIVARKLGPADFGLFSGLYAVAQAASIIVDFGLITLLLRDFARLKLSERLDQPAGHRAEALLQASFTLNVAVSAVVIVGSLVAAATLGLAGPAIWALGGVTAYTCLVAGATVIEALFRASRRFGLTAATSLSDKVFLIAVLPVVTAGTPRIELIGAAYLAAGLVRLTFVLVVLHRSFGVPLRLSSAASAIHIGKRSMPFAINRAVLTLVSRADTAVVAVFSAVDAAYFALADRSMLLFIVVATAASTTLYPFLQRSSASPERLTRLMVSAMGVAGLVLAGIGISLAPMLVPAAFGEAYRGATLTLQIMFASVPLIFATNALMVSLYTAGRERSVAKYTAVVSVAGTVGVIAGELWWGSEGAAAGYVLRQAAFFGALVVLAGTSRKLPERASARAVTAQ